MPIIAHICTNLLLSISYCVHDVRHPFVLRRFFLWRSVEDAVCLAFFHFILFSRFCFPASGQAVVIGLVPSLPRYGPSCLSRRGFSISQRSSNFVECHAFALSSINFLHMKKSLGVRKFTRGNANIEIDRSSYQGRC